MPDDSAPPEASPEGVSYLMEALRSRAPGYIPDGSLAISPAPQGAAVDGPAGAENAGNRLRELLGTAMPDGGPYDYQFLYGLKVIAESMASKDDDETMLNLVYDIYENRPKFPDFPFAEEEGAEIIAKLYHKLKDYKKISEGDLNKLPYFEVLGHRRDDIILNLKKDYFPGIMGLGPEAKEINEILDLFAPHSAYYSRLRREIIEAVDDKGEKVATWVDRGWYGKEKDKFMESLKQKIEPWQKERERLKQQLMKRLGQERQSNRVVPLLEVATVRSIRDLIRQVEAVDRPEEPAAKRRRGDDGLPVGGRPPLVPEHLTAAVCRQAPGRTDINEFARTTANWYADVMDAVIPPTERGNFAKRVRLTKELSYPEAISTVTSIRSRLKSKDAELQELERLSDAFHQAWQGTLRELPSPPEVRAREEKAAVPKIKWRKPAGYNARVKAGNAPNQIKLKDLWQGGQQDARDPAEHTASPSAQPAQDTPAAGGNSVGGGDADGGIKAWVRIDEGRYLSLERYQEWMKNPDLALDLPADPKKLQVLVPTEYGDGCVEPGRLKSMMPLADYIKRMEDHGLLPELSDVAHTSAPPELARHGEDWLLGGAWLGTDLDGIAAGDKFVLTTPPGGKFIGFMPQPIFEERQREKSAERKAPRDKEDVRSASPVEPGADDPAATRPIRGGLMRPARSDERGCRGGL